MTTYLELFDAAGDTAQWPIYTPAGVRLFAATGTLLRYTGRIADGDFAGETVTETYRGRFQLSDGVPAGRVGSVDIVIGGEHTLGVRYDEPIRIRAYQSDFAHRMSGDVSFRGNAFANRIETGGGDDTLMGGGGDDALSAGGGNDRLFGGAGRDRLSGGAGADTMAGGAGNDDYIADAGDRLSEAAGGGRDTVRALADYRLPLNFEALVLVADAASGTGNGARNWLTGNARDNMLFGLAGGDVMSGLAGADTLIGGFGDDTLIGGTRPDRLTGGAGDDVLDGGTHGDWLTGGSGRDTFVFSKPNDSAAALRDVISDFARGDRIDLSGIDARPGHAGDDAFRFIGGRLFDGQAGELRYAHGLVSGDVDGDGAADFVIRVLGTPTLGVHDFVL